MLRVLHSPSAAERIAAAAEFIRSFAAATELLLVGSSREAVDDLVRGLAHTNSATFGLHRFSFTQLAARLAIRRLAAAGVTPSSAVGAEAFAARSAYEATVRNELHYFAPVTKFPGFARATAATIGDLRAADVAAEKLETLEESGPNHAALLECFEEQMNRVLVADRTLLLQAALEEVRAGADLAKCPLLLLDVPVHSAIERPGYWRGKTGWVGAIGPKSSKLRNQHVAQLRDHPRKPERGSPCTSQIKSGNSSPITRNTRTRSPQPSLLPFGTHDS